MFALLMQAAGYRMVETKCRRAITHHDCPRNHQYYYWDKRNAYHVDWVKDERTDTASLRTR